VRYFFTRLEPKASRILLIESGSRYLLEGLISGIRTTYGTEILVDLVTCYPGLPEGFYSANTTVYRVTDYRGRAGRARLFRELARNRYSIAGIICSAEPIMTKWKWMIAAKVPAKLFVLNENGDYFWFDRTHLDVIGHFILFRAGLTGAAAVPTLVRLLMFPFSLTYLLLYAGFVHLRRKIRLVLGGAQ
jgi:hypothetical protein